MPRDGRPQPDQAVRLDHPPGNPRLHAKMRVFVPVLTLAAVVAVSAGFLTAPRAQALQGHDTVAPAAMAQEGEHPSEPSSGRDVDAPVFWSIVGVIAGAVVMAGLYVVKRALGGFPKNPSWTAPISVERSSTFLDDTKLGDLPAGSHASPH